MERSNQLKVKFTLVLGEKEEIKTKKVFYGSLLVIFLFVAGTLATWFFRISWQKIISRLKIWRQSLMPKFSPQRTPLRNLFLLVVFNLSLWGWLNREDILLIYQPLIKTIKEVSFPIALGKMEEGVILGTEDAVKISELQGNSEPKFLGEDKNLNLSLTEERCQKNQLEKKSSELCGKDPQDEELDKELAHLDYLEKLKKIKSVSRPKKINAPGPHVFEKDSSGRKVCNKSNDKPGKSDKGKGKHMDMECCLDPDEYPNPHCYYPPGKYGKFL